ncbi:hypothetical protein PAAG_00659 [Paracoccidioides lutzii Pb01]|uniref:Sec20 C-terminal domain-containing protein n=1 Tax=Paracoccidioides lutzii (strain ATCC MYA-826 / Pb01) TaxID=502779 RepID=C1GQ64_PARBA|nr:hypothetical protein PAAG_00659 [Paracoccidioides lutzii Pb01]EEH37738.1 hypothetical protein PAAG_00659 [Paracoccidioides lutzii Pb01]
MASPGLQSRITSLSTTHKQTIQLIQRLQNFPATPGTGDDARLELGAEIHLRLKEMEEQMELLRVELEQLEAAWGSTKRWGSGGAKEAKKERMVVVIGKLEEDLKSARLQFRKAQLQAKRNAEVARRKERQLLFAGVGGGEGGEGVRRKGRPGFTHDDLVASASEDVTSALRRTHQLMQAELSRSQFAQETLEQSTAALRSLSESYSSLDSLLASSRSLVSSLLRSQKSDTWYLETSFYILVGTIIWLVFRRILYGPLWWILWIPLKLTFRTAFVVLGGIGLANTSTSSYSSGGSVGEGSTMISLRTPGATIAVASSPMVHTVTLNGAVTSAADSQKTKTPQADNEDVLEKIEKIVGKESDHVERGTNVDDISPEERRRQEAMPRNPKKRMHEEKFPEDRKKDEL